MAEKIRWGLLSTARIAGNFAAGLAALPDAEIVAVGSRSQESADQFADRLNIPRRHSSYEALAHDPDVDVIYIGTPHPLHAENTLLCLEAGKHVLCEKPFALNTAQAERMVDTARRQQRFLMEAMWTRFQPAWVRIREIIAAGTIGEVRMLLADFGFRTDWNPEGRLLNPALGGGGLLDVGIYPITLAAMLFGQPEQITSAAHLGETGVDEQGAVILAYNGGQLASLTFGVRTKTPMVATICGTEGSIHVPAPWWKAQKFVLTVGDKNETHDFPFIANGYEYEAAEVGRCIRQGQLESAVMPLDETLANLRVLDQIRAQWGLRYPGE
jgi:predicted dehydrogenase